MPEKAHYNYNSEIDLKPKSAIHQDKDLQVPIRVDVQGVKFMVPIEIEFEIVNTITDEIIGESVRVGGGIDIRNEELSLHKKFPDPVNEEIKKSVFQFIWNNMQRPDGEYEAGEDVYKQAERATKEHNTLHEENIQGE